MPAITIGPGLDKLDGGVEAGRALREKYFADCYHQACDAWTPSWDPSGHAADTLVVYDLGAELAPTAAAGPRGKRNRSSAARVTRAKRPAVEVVPAAGRQLPALPGGS